MTRLRTYDPLLGDCRRLRQLTDTDYREHSPLVLLLVAALAAFLVGLGWAAWMFEAGAL